MTACCHCKRSLVVRGRGLCASCYKRPEVRERYPRRNCDYHVFTTLEVRQIASWRVQSPPIPWHEIARRIGYRGHWQCLAQQATKHGVPNRGKGTIDLERLRQLHEEGYSDRDKAERLGVCKTTVVKYRLRLGLPAHGNNSERARERLREQAKAIPGKCGFESHAEMIAAVSALKAARMGWPQAQTPGEAKILQALHDAEQLTFVALRQRLGLSTNCRQGHTCLILGRLVKRGLVVMYSDRAVSGDGRRRLYRLAEGVRSYQPEGRRPDGPRSVREPTVHRVAVGG